jgi:hypothetical protein
MMARHLTWVRLGAMAAGFLLAASALPGPGGGAGARGKAQHSLDHGRRHRLDAGRGLSPRLGARRNTQH